MRPDDSEGILLAQSSESLVALHSADANNLEVDISPFAGCARRDPSVLFVDCILHVDQVVQVSVKPVRRWKNIQGK
jgi:hypothetical protein